MPSAIRMCTRVGLYHLLLLLLLIYALAQDTNAPVLLQAFANVVLALCDASDTVALFVPYYFNHLMAFQMTGITNILLGPSDPETFYPDLGAHYPYSFVLGRTYIFLFRLSFPPFLKHMMSSSV
jgi:hypothetical protein